MFRGRRPTIHFVGIGGIGMSGIAEVLSNLGYPVTGSDLRDNEATRRLQSFGARIFLGHAEENVGGADVVVYSSAVRDDNPELRAARAHGIPVIPRAEMLAELMRLKYGIAVAGSHGKTTTTSLVAHLLAAGGFDPTAVVGGKINAFGSNAKLGKGEYMVVEADESDGSFLRFSPAIAVITNIDPEHLEHYGDFEALQDAFLEFANRVPFYGISVLCLDHPVVQALLPRVERRAITYGFSAQSDYRATTVEAGPLEMRFDLVRRGEVFPGFRLP
ncbi:MAG TPA: Mur ligase domain-containing protein, partial [Fredinandcohnia sp.]|nr:Mur ligase domain-containing protein [Fredinandcohnia sp.]